MFGEMGAKKTGTLTDAQDARWDQDTLLGGCQFFAPEFGGLRQL